MISIHIEIKESDGEIVEATVEGKSENYTPGEAAMGNVLKRTIEGTLATIQKMSEAFEAAEAMATIGASLPVTQDEALPV